MPVEFIPEYHRCGHAKGNHLMTRGNTYRATVSAVRRRWWIIVNGFGVSRTVEDEFFDDVSETKCRAVMIAAGKVDNAYTAMNSQRH